MNEEAHTSFESCRSACESNTMCLQFLYSNSNCLISSEVRLGRKATLQCLGYSIAASNATRLRKGLENLGKTSLGVVRFGWMVDRLARYVSVMDQTCSDRMV